MIECKKCSLGFNNNYIPFEPVGDAYTAKVFIIFDTTRKKDFLKKELVEDNIIKKLYFDLSIIGFAKSDIYITYLVRCQKFAKSVDDEEYIKTCSNYTVTDFSHFTGGIVLLIGHKSVNYFLNGTCILARDFGKTYFYKNSIFIPIPNLNNLYANTVNTQLYTKLLVKGYFHYKNNFEANHKSIYETNTITENRK